MAGFILFFSFCLGDIPNRLQYEGIKKNLRFLEMAKYHLINGHPNKARFSLRKVFANDERVILTNKRYSAVIDFIKGDYQSSLTTLKNRFFLKTIDFYKSICSLKILNMILVKRPKIEIKTELARCQSATLDSSPNNLFLIEALSQHSHNKDSTVFLKYLHALNDESIATPWVKTALYLGMENVVLKNHSFLSQDSYLSKETREALGFVYLRSGNLENSKSILEGFDSVNVKNIKGHLALRKKDYKSAWRFFRFASQDNPLSDATSKLVLLSWIMKEWEEGLKSSKNLTSSLLDEKDILAMQTAYLIKLGKPLRWNLNLLEGLYEDILPFHVEILNAYGRLFSNERRDALASSEILCEKFSGTACWLYSQLQLHSNLPLLMESMEAPFNEPQIMLLKLKEKSSISPLKENLFIDQRDIDDLDLAEALKENT